MEASRRNVPRVSAQGRRGRGEGLTSTTREGGNMEDKWREHLMEALYSAEVGGEMVVREGCRSSGRFMDVSWKMMELWNVGETEQ